MSSDPRCVLIWVQHLLGSGHFVRAGRIADALAARGQRVVLMTGGPPLGRALHADVELVQLPWCQAADSSFSGMVDQHGRPVDDAFWRGRMDVILRTVERLQPNFVLTEMYPFGRRAFTQEVTGLIDKARAMRRELLIGCSLRDILVTRTHEKSRMMAQRFLETYDVALVHSDERIMPLSVSFPWTDLIAERLHYTGYIGPAFRMSDAQAASGVLITGGGGRVAVALHETAMQLCNRGFLQAHEWTFVTGRQYPRDDYQRLQTSAPENARILDYTSDLPSLMQQSSVIVSQAGYNSAVELLLSRRPHVLVPFVHPGEDEQLVRARRLEELGSSQLVHPDALTIRTLAKKMEQALAHDRPCEDISVRGVDHTTAKIVEMMDGLNV